MIVGLRKLVGGSIVGGNGLYHSTHDLPRMMELRIIFGVDETDFHSIAPRKVYEFLTSRIGERGEGWRILRTLGVRMISMGFK